MGNCFAAQKKKPKNSSVSAVSWQNADSAGTATENSWEGKKSFQSKFSGFSGVSNYFSFAKEEEKKEKKTFHDVYFLGEKLGQGAFAQVHTVARLKSDVVMHRAVKIVDMRLASPQLPRLLEKEINVWKKVGKHEHCVRLFDVFYGSNLCYMVMEKCTSNLFRYLEKIPGLNEISLGKVFFQMLIAVKHLHVFHIVHRDVKPDNFLVGGEDGNTVKLTDFGLSAAIPKEGGRLTGECGTAPFMSPEMLQGKPYDEKTDIWSFAVVVYCLLFGRFPFKTNKGIRHSGEMKRAITDPESSISFRGKCTCQAVAFSMLLFNRDPVARPSAERAMELSYMKAVQKKDHASVPYKLHCLSDILRLAKFNKVFDSIELQENHGLDDYLNTLQIQKHGKGVPTSGEEDDVMTNRVTTRSNKSTKSKNMRGSISTMTRGSTGSINARGSARGSTLSSKAKYLSLESEESLDFYVSEGSSVCSV